MEHAVESTVACQGTVWEPRRITHPSAGDGTILHGAAAGRQDPYLDPDN